MTEMSSKANKYGNLQYQRHQLTALVSIKVIHIHRGDNLTYIIFNSLSCLAISSSQILCMLNKFDNRFSIFTQCTS